MKNIAVIGAGTMGNGIAHVFAQNNYNVHLIDISQEALNKGISTISKNLDRLIDKEKITLEIKNKTISNISTYISIAEGVKKCDLVVEAATENIDLKLNIFKQLDEAASENTILASNLSKFFAKPGRCRFVQPGVNAPGTPHRITLPCGIL